MLLELSLVFPHTLSLQTNKLTSKHLSRVFGIALGTYSVAELLQVLDRGVRAALDVAGTGSERCG